MTPAARVAAAIAVLDGIAAGTPAEKALTNWARASRFAGSKDRAAVRDLVFDALRRRRSFAAYGGAADGRGLMLGALRLSDSDPQAIFTGEGYAPAPLSAAEQAHLSAPPQMTELERLDCPDWLGPALRQSLGDDFAPVMERLQHRAPVFLRANLRKARRDQAQDELARAQVDTRPHPLSETALEVSANARRVQGSTAYQSGLVELQDAASQAVCDMLDLPGAARVLDYCAGGGGKALALAARQDLQIFAHDANMGRMRDLPARADRAGVCIQTLAPGDPPRHAPYDLVLCDVPCSGSGSWRRAPEGKWRLDMKKLADLIELQWKILCNSADMVAPDGTLAYVTCSLLQAENSDQIARFLHAYPAWQLCQSRQLTPLDGGDGFYVAILRRKPGGAGGS